MLLPNKRVRNRAFTGCFDYQGLGEGLGIHHAVEWLDTQEWSNGNVGLYGKSYREQPNGKRPQ